MTRLRRLAATVFAMVIAVALAPGSAVADHCPDQPTSPPDWCHQEPPPGDPTPRPTPKPTPQPTRPPTPAPTQPPAPPQPASRPRPANPNPRPAAPAAPSATTTPETTPPLEIEEETDDGAEPQIIVEGQAEGDEGTLDRVEDAASAQSWIFGFIVGLIIGALIGRASWGIRRRRRQQIFG